MALTCGSLGDEARRWTRRRYARGAPRSRIRRVDALEDFRGRSGRRRAIPSNSANSALSDFFQPLAVIPAAGCARHADGCDLPARTDAALVPFAGQNFIFNTRDAIALRHVVGIVAVETHVGIPDVVPFTVALAVAKGSNEAVDGPAMLEP